MPYANNDQLAALDQRWIGRRAGEYRIVKRLGSSAWGTCTWLSTRRRASAQP